MSNALKTADGFAQANAGFIDLLLRRWEQLLDFQTTVRHGFHDPDRPPSLEALQAELGAIDQALGTLRKQAKGAGRAFPLDQVTVTYGLDGHEAQILELALLPQLDLAFRQRIARYNNNILYDFVDVDFVLGLLFPARVDRLQARAYFATTAPLIKHRLLVFGAPKDAKGSGLLAHELRPPERLADYVLCRRSLDSSLQDIADMVDPSVPLTDVALPSEVREELTSFIKHFSAVHGDGTPAAPFPDGSGLTLVFVGAHGTGKSLVTEAVAHELGRPLIVVHSARLATLTDGAAHVAYDALFSEAKVQGAVLVFDRCEPLFTKGSQRMPALLGHLERFGGLAVLTTSAPDALDPAVERFVTWQQQMNMPTVEERDQIWRLHLPTAVPLAEDVDLDDLSTRYEVNGGQIKNACLLAEKEVAARVADGAEVTLELLKHCAQAQLRADMEEYSVKSSIQLTLKDLVLPDKEKVLIQEFLDACINRVFVMSKWGFGKRLVTGKGITALFKGEPGTGKTLCAEILARELGMRLYQISIPKIVSKYIGETEKNISRIFQTARANHSMLLFDEADALFTKRVSVENAIDRFSNMEVNLLLQEIERFEGITILTTNLDKNIDDAFSRRIQFKITFPFPEPDHRALIWRGLIPKECPIDDGVDFVDLGEAYELSGGFIKNAVVRAAYRAAAKGTSISWADIEFAAEQECKSAGKLFRTSTVADDW